MQASKGAEDWEEGGKGRGLGLPFSLFSRPSPFYACHIGYTLTYLKCQQTRPQQQTSEWCRISQLQIWISTIKLVEKYKTANWSLWQGDEEVNKKMKQKIYIFKQIARYFGLKTNLLQGLWHLTLHHAGGTYMCIIVEPLTPLAQLPNAPYLPAPPPPPNLA